MKIFYMVVLSWFINVSASANQLIIYDFIDEIVWESSLCDKGCEYYSEYGINYIYDFETQKTYIQLEDGTCQVIRL